MTKPLTVLGIETSCDETAAAVVRGLPGHYYTDPAIFEAEKRKIFFRTWQCLGHVCMLPEKTSYFTASVVDQDVAVIRGEDGEIRAFFNICQHRGHPLLKGAGTARRIICPYHAWTYDASGQLRNAPHTAGVNGFEISSVRLAPVRCAPRCSRPSIRPIAGRSQARGRCRCTGACSTHRVA